MALRTDRFPVTSARHFQHTVVFFCMKDFTIRVWNLATGGCRRLESSFNKLMFTPAGVATRQALPFLASFLPSDCRLSSFSQVWQPCAGTPMQYLRCHCSARKARQPYPWLPQTQLDGRAGRALSSSWDRSLRLWDLDKQVATLV